MLPFYMQVHIRREGHVRIIGVVQAGDSYNIIDSETWAYAPPMCACVFMCACACVSVCG